MSAEGLVDYALSSYGVVITLEDATDWRSAFFKTYRGYRIWMIREKALARATGCARVYWLGKPYRRRWLPGVGSRSRGENSHALRQSLNTAVQGLAAEWTLRALNQCRVAFRKGELPGVRSLNFTIHDSIGAVVEEDMVQDAFVSMAKIMVGIPTLRVPLSVEGKAGPSLGDLTEIGVYP